jgi:sec-independent protein translocase protein TatC
MTDAADDTERPLIAHLLELRSRLLRGVVGLLVVLARPAAARQQAVRAARAAAARQAAQGRPADRHPGRQPVLRTDEAGVLRGAWWWRCRGCSTRPGPSSRPACTAARKRLALPLLSSALLLFYAGCAFAYFLVLPTVFGFLARVTPDGVAMMTDISSYLDFVLVLFLAFGLAFELPVALVILVLLGWVTPAQLREGRGYAVVGIFVVAAVVTPPDVISQLMLAVPMCLLYEAGILAASMVSPRTNADGARTD